MPEGTALSIDGRIRPSRQKAARQIVRVLKWPAEDARRLVDDMAEDHVLTIQQSARQSPHVAQLLVTEVVYLHRLRVAYRERRAHLDEAPRAA